MIAYYDSIHKSLRAVLAVNAGATPAFGAPVTIDGDQPTPALKHDAGRFPSLTIGPTTAASGRIAITYQDVTAQSLLLYTSNGLNDRPTHADDGKAGLVHAIDRGLPAAGETWHSQSFPGVQSGVAFTPSGKIAVVYQDGMPVDLVFATFDPSTNKVGGKSTVRSEGATGFYPRVVIDAAAGTAYLSSATIRAATAQLSANTLILESRPAQ